MATFSKTNAGTLISMQSITGGSSSSVVTSSAVDVSTKMGGLVFVRFGRANATAGTAGVNIRLEASFHASADNSWQTFAQFTTAFATATSSAYSSGGAAGANTVTVASGTGFTSTDWIFIANSTFANSEFAKVKGVSGAVITVEDNFVNSCSGQISDAAEIFPPVAIPAAACRIRAVVDGVPWSANAFGVEVRYSTIDGIA